MTQQDSPVEDATRHTALSVKIVMLGTAMIPYVSYAVGIAKNQPLTVAFGWFIGFIASLMAFAWIAGRTGDDGKPARPSGKLLFFFAVQFVLMSIGLGISLPFVSFD